MQYVFDFENEEMRWRTCISRHVTSLISNCNCATSTVRLLTVIFAHPQVPMALPTCGRVLLDTTAGDIDIELWSKVRDATMTYAC